MRGISEIVAKTEKFKPKLGFGVREGRRVRCLCCGGSACSARYFLMFEYYQLFPSKVLTKHTGMGL